MHAIEPWVLVYLVPLIVTIIAGALLGRMDAWVLPCIGILGLLYLPWVWVVGAWPNTAWGTPWLVVMVIAVMIVTLIWAIIFTPQPAGKPMAANEPDYRKPYYLPPDPNDTPPIHG